MQRLMPHEAADYRRMPAEADRMARGAKDDPLIAQLWRDLADTHRMLAAQIERLK
jgi:hypothetical protein